MKKQLSFVLAVVIAGGITLPLSVTTQVDAQPLVADITINIAGILRNQPSAPNFHGIIGAICYNYTTGEQVRNNNIPFSAANPDPITVSCVKDLNMTPPSPGDNVRIAITGVAAFIPNYRQIIAFVTGLGTIIRAECRNNDTLDIRIERGSASDTTHCGRIDVGAGPFGGQIIGESTLRGDSVALAFNGTVADPAIPVCPCFSENRLEHFMGFSGPNVTPTCVDNTDPDFTSGDINADFAPGYTLNVTNVSSNTATVNECRAFGGAMVFDKRPDLTQAERQACRAIIQNRCP